MVHAINTSIDKGECIEDFNLEFLNDGLNGILYSSNKENSLLNALVKFNNLKNSKEKIINAKKQCRQYTKFNHNKSLTKIILNEN